MNQRQARIHRKRLRKARIKILAISLKMGIAGFLLIITLFSTAFSDWLNTNGGQDSPESSPSEEPNIEVIAPNTHTPANTPTPSKEEAHDARMIALASEIPLVNFDHRNEEHEPDNLAYLPDYIGELAVLNTDVEFLDEQAAEHLLLLLEGASDDGIDTFIINSAYRSKEQQEIIYSRRLAQEPDYGDDPYNNPVKTVPSDVSEHCTGLAVDLLSLDFPYGVAGYEQTEESIWLSENAHKYGFILRYPKGKEHITGIVYESWHYRYVGIELATDIYESGLCLEEYLLKLGVIDSIGYQEDNPAEIEDERFEDMNIADDDIAPKSDSPK